MEKRNVIEVGRTPVMEKQGDIDLMEKQAVRVFDQVDEPKLRKCTEKHCNQQGE